MTSRTPVTNRYLTLLVLSVALIVSVGSLIYFYQQGLTNIYGDGLYHLNTARKMVDNVSTSWWNRYAQLGSPWLPLPHLLMLPFIGHDFFWRSGLAGSLVSMVSFVLAAVLIFKLSLLYYGDRFARPHWVALLSVLIFISNPSNLYMQTTPMTELPYMAVLLASVYALQKWAFTQRRSWLIVTGGCMALGTITRYEAWSLLPLAGGIILLASERPGWRKLEDGILWGLVAAMGPLYWFWHNWAIYGNPLEFYNGPYSARGIYARSSGSYDWVNISYQNIRGSMLVAAVTTVLCVSLLGFLLGVSGYVTELINRFAFRPTERRRFVIDGYWRELLARRREWSRYLPVFLLGVPFCFFVYSLYKNEIQVIPLAMMSLYNVRYGLPHLVAAAIFAPAVLLLFKPERRMIVLALLALLVVGQYGLVLREGALQLEIIQEPYRNNVNSPEWRNKAKLEAYLLANPPATPVLMESGYLGSSVLRGGLTFSQVIHDGNGEFHQIETEIPPSIQTVIMKDGDQLWRKFRHEPGFNEQFEAVFISPGAPQLVIYRRRSVPLKAANP